jgi:hypothetical protein
VERDGIDSTVDRSGRAAMSGTVARIAGMRVRATVRDREQDRDREEVRGPERVRDRNRDRNRDWDTDPAQARDRLEDMANVVRKADAMIVMIAMIVMQDRKHRLAEVPLEVSREPEAGWIRIDRLSRAELDPVGTEAVPVQAPRGIAADAGKAREVSPFSAWAGSKENGWISAYPTT